MPTTNGPRLQAAIQRPTWHVWVALGWAFASAAGYALLPDGHVARLLVVAPFILIVPGHLLVQACVASQLRTRPRMGELAFAVGVSPVVLGLAALATALVPGGFTPTSIVAATTLVCAGLAALALTRHTIHHWSDARRFASRT